MKKCTDFRIKKRARGEPEEYKISIQKHCARRRATKNVTSETLRAAAENEKRHFKNFPYTSETGAKEANVSG